MLAVIFPDAGVYCNCNLLNKDGDLRRDRKEHGRSDAWFGIIAWAYGVCRWTCFIVSVRRLGWDSVCISFL